MALSDVTVDLQEAVAATLESSGNKVIQERVDQLKEKAIQTLISQDFTESSIKVETYFNCHFAQSTTQLMIKIDPKADLVKTFLDTHFELYGFILQNRDVLVESVRVRAVGLSPSSETTTPYKELSTVSLVPADCPFTTQKIYFDGLGWQESKTIALEDLTPGSQVEGPAIIYDKTQTILVEPGFVATALSKHIIIDLQDANNQKTVSSDVVDPVQVSVFSHR